MINTETSNIGTQLKIAVKLTCANLSMDDYDFTCRFWTFTDSYVDVKKEEMVKDGDTYIAIVDTEKLSEGRLKITATAEIPDIDTGGIRKEITTRTTDITLKKN